MMKGRPITAIVAAFVAGNFLGDALSFPPFVYLVLAASLSLIFFFSRTRLSSFACFVFLGAASLQISRIPATCTDNLILRRAEEAKTAFSSYLERYISSGDELSVLKALAIGDKASLTPELKSAYKGSGAMHLLALSGLHVSIIYGFTSFLLKLLGGYPFFRMLRSVILLGLLWIYALVSGLSPSISRAVLMITFYEISGYVSYVRDGPSALAASALIITMINPEAPRQISFQLSYAAMISIYTVFPWLRNMLRTRSLLLKYCWATLAMSISCQLTCGTLGWIYFGTFPKYFLLTAIIAMPLATVVMYSIAVTLLTVWIPPLNNLAAELLRFLIHIMNQSLTVISQLQ